MQKDTTYIQSNCRKAYSQNLQKERRCKKLAHIIKRCRGSLKKNHQLKKINGPKLYATEINLETN